MRVRALSISLTALAGTSVALARQNTPRIISEVSTEPALGWNAALTVAPGTRVYIRTRIRLDNPEAQVIGLGGITCQPTLSGWQDGSDALYIPFCIPDPFCPPEEYNGRRFPFSSVGMGSGSASGLLRTFVDPGGTLRWAGANNTTMTTNPAWGVHMSQLTPQLGGTNFVGGTDVATFHYSVVVGDTGAERTLIASVPLAGIQNARTTWFRTTNGSNSLLAPITADGIVSAEIHVIPAPASIVPFALSLFAMRRRRS
jgi:hypothetical protein